MATETAQWWRRALKLAADVLEPEGNPAGAVYGTITVGALLAAESTRRETTGEAFGSVVVALLLYWLAHAYADALGERLEHGRRFRPRALAHELRRSATIVRGSTVPLAAMLVSWAAGTGTHASVLAALFAAAGALILLELIAAVRGRSSAAELVTELSVSAVLGLGILALKVVLH